MLLKNYILPDSNYYKNKEWLKYAEEADILNVALFNTTAREWRKLNPELAKTSNIRDYAGVNELTVLSNLESHNAEMIKEGNREVKRNVQYYNLDMVISVGYKVNSDRAIQFRRWATNILKEFSKKGYIIDKKEWRMVHFLIKIIMILYLLK